MKPDDIKNIIREVREEERQTAEEQKKDDFISMLIFIGIILGIALVFSLLGYSYGKIQYKHGYEAGKREASELKCGKQFKFKQIFSESFGTELYRSAILMTFKPSDAILPPKHTSECGNGIAQKGEECDDGNQNPGDGCSPSCTVEECGNGIIDHGEECDDGNDNDADGCTMTCQNNLCGNGIINGGEQCDDGNYKNGDGCSINCTLEKLKH